MYENQASDAANKHCYYADEFGNPIWTWVRYYYDNNDNYYEERGETTTVPFSFTIECDSARLGEKFSNGYLDCSKNPLSHLDLSKAKNLKTLSCWNCDLTSLDLSACDSLRVLRMSNNRINEIDLSHCTQLEELYANNWVGVKGRASWNYGFTSLDLSGLSKLRLAQLSRNKMRDLNLSGCTTLQTLTCDNQGGDERLLRTLNLTGCNNLTNLECQNNGLTSLKMDDCTSLSSSTLKAYTQRAVEDVVVLDRNKVCIELANGITNDFTMDDLFDTWDKSNFTKTCWRN